MKALKRQWLNKLRRSRNFTREDMACLMHISRSHYSNIENGRCGLRGSMSRDHFVTISMWFRVSTDNLHEWEDAYLAEAKKHQDGYE